MTKMETMTVEKKKREFPDTYVFVFIFIVIAALLTYIIPAGMYDSFKNAAGRSVVDPNTFHFVAQAPVSFKEFITAPFNGMKKGANVIFQILLVCGFFGIINSTGTIDATFQLAVNKLQDKIIVVIPVIMLVIAVLGAMQIVSNAIIAFIAIGIVLCKQLKLDPLLVMAIIFVPNQIGFACTPMGAFSLIVAQQIADLPLMSGFAYRTAFFVISMIVDIAWTVKYAMKIRKDPSKSLIGVYKTEAEDEIAASDFTWKHAITLATLFIGFFLYGYESIMYGWGIDMLTGVLLVISLLAAVIAQKSPNEIAKAFIAGAKQGLYGAMLVGLASAILILMQNGKIIHSIVHYVTIPLTYLPRWISAIGMFIVNIFINFLVPSGSGQAYLVMPIMAPMADVLGISRQVAILAYQYGDGYANMIIPTGGTTMACMAMCGIPYPKWMKFIMPLYMSLFVVGCISITLGIMIGLQ